MSGASAAPSPAAWPAAARLIARWLDDRERIDALLDTLPRSLSGTERARCQHLVLGVVRHFGRIDAALARLVTHPPRFSTRAVLFVAGFELLEAAGAESGSREGHAAKIVHHAVEQTKLLASEAEARMVNAVTRKLAQALPRPAPAADATAGEWAEFFSHPEWLVRSWLAEFGREATRALLEWNQQPAPVYARWRPTPGISPAASEAAPVTAGEASAPPAPPDFLRPTSWPDLFLVEPRRWSEVEPLLKSGQIYLQDPATRIAVDLLAPQPGESVLDLCAAPGGKSLLIADRLRPTGGAAATGRLVAVDLPGPRIERLKDNLSRAGIEVALVQADVIEGLGEALRVHGLPPAYPAVLLDAPCSNTGVMRHRVDVKWRLQAGDFKKHPRQQVSLLHAAARAVAPGGRLVYSTCSIMADENEHVVADFLAGRAGEAFKVESRVVSHPWVTGHDGGAAFCLRRRS